MRNYLTIILLLVGFISPQQGRLNAQQGIPRTLSVQGVLTSAFGLKPLTGKQVFRVGIYESPLGGIPLHEQIDTVLVGETGLYQFSLGGMKGLPRTVKFDKPYFIDISVNGEKQNMRIPLQSAAYAFMAGAVESDAVGVDQLSPDLREKLFPEKDKSEGTFANYVNGLRAVIAGGDENRTSANYASILGGFTNNVSGFFGTIGGGQGNNVQGSWSFVGGGANNRAFSNYSTIGAGSNNTVTSSGLYATIGGGRDHQAGGVNSFIGGGSSNMSAGLNAMVGGGASNRAMQSNSVVGGGSTNLAQGVSSSILGGANNTASGENSFIGGGRQNNASGAQSVISGGMTNTVSGASSGIASGQSNSVTNANSIIAGGLSNSITSMNSVISGGSSNVNGGNFSVIAGGGTNTVTTFGAYSAISGGQTNTNQGRHSTIAGGFLNGISQNSLRSVISGGDTNTITHTTPTSTSNSSAIAGGTKNTITNSNWSIITGGRRNDITGSNFAFVGGGDDNNVATGGQYSTIGGGVSNDILDSDFAFVGGGNNNNIFTNSDYAAILGGSTNNATGALASIVGSSNTVNALEGTAIGILNTTSARNGMAIGYSNTVSGNYGVAIGTLNTVNGTDGMAIGKTATAGAGQLYSKFSAGHVFEGEGTSIGNYVSQFYNPTPGGNGIKIKIANPIPSISNYFMNFENASGGSVGRITGQTLSEMHASTSYREEKRKLEKERDLKIQKAVTGGLAMVSKTKKAVQSGIEVIAGPPQIASATASSVATLGAGSGWTANEIARYAFKIAGAAGDISDALVAGYQEGQAISEATLAKEKFQHWIDKKDAQVGVTYESGAADYAEWLPKQEQNIDYAESDIVGIHQGKIRYETEGAEQLMVVSSRPMILGNMPAFGKEHEFEAVAFMGQVPVSVLGAVTKGDFILPSGGNHGLGIAVHPENMRNEDFGKIVGIAWSDAPDTFAINKVNVAVGLQTTTLANQICKQSKEISELKKTVRMIQTSLIAMSNNQSKTANLSDKLDNIFYLANDQSIIDSEPSLIKETKIPVHAMHKECLIKLNALIPSNDVSTLQINTSMQSALGNDPILKELYIYSIIQRLKN